MSKNGEMDEHDAVIEAFRKAFGEAGPSFDWDYVNADEMRGAVQAMGAAGISVAYISYLGGRTVTVRLSDRDGQDVHHCVTAAELDVLHGALQLDGAATWARSRFTPYPRGSRRR